MSLEMFNGKTGARLIARLPVAPMSYADVALEPSPELPDGATIRLMYLGGSINGYPALSPILTDLDQVYPHLSGLLRAIKRDMQQEAIAWSELSDKLAHQVGELEQLLVALPPEAIRYSDLATLLFGGIEQMTIENRARYLRRMGAKAPLCPRVMVGAMLQLRTPVVYGAVSALDLGVVRHIDIHNEEPTS